MLLVGVVTVEIQRPLVPDSPLTARPYHAKLEGGVSTFRSLSQARAQERGPAAAQGEESIPCYGPTHTIQILLTPEGSPTGEPPRAVAYLQQPDGVYRLVSPEPTRELRDTGQIALKFPPASALLGEDFGAHHIQVMLVQPGASIPERFTSKDRPAPNVGVLLPEQSLLYGAPASCEARSQPGSRRG